MFYRVVNNRGGKRHLHTDRDCSRIKKGKGVRQVKRSNFPDAPICSGCSGEANSPIEQDHSAYHALLEAGKE